MDLGAYVLCIGETIVDSCIKDTSLILECNFTVYSLTYSQILTFLKGMTDICSVGVTVVLYFPLFLGEAPSVLRACLAW